MVASAKAELGAKELERGDGEERAALTSILQVLVVLSISLVNDHERSESFA